MIIYLGGDLSTCHDYAYVKYGTVKDSVLNTARSTLPFVVVSREYKRKKPVHDGATNKVRQHALAIFGLYNNGDLRMVRLHRICKDEYKIHLVNLLNPDEQLRLKSDTARAVDQIVLDYLENKVLADIADQLRDKNAVSEEVRTEALQAVEQFAAEAAKLINYTVQDRAELARPLENVQRDFREDRLKAAVAQLNGYTAAVKELTS